MKTSEDTQAKTQVEHQGAEQGNSLTEEQIKGVFATKDKFKDFTKAALYEEVIDPATGTVQGLIHITDPYNPHGVVVSLPTQASKQEVEKIVKRISPIPEFCHMLAKMAECYELGYPCIIEGGTAVGKTFMVNKFTELLYGKGVKPLDFFCSGQTDVSELMGKWVPKEGTAPEVQARWEKFLESEYAKNRLQAIDEGIAKSGASLSMEEKSKMYQARIQQLAQEAGLGVDGADFTFQLGAIPKAFTGEYRDGKFRVRDGADGFIVHVQEAGLAKPAVLNALLRVRGEQGQIEEHIQLWEDGGRVIPRGLRTFIVFTNNPVDGYLDRKAIDPALGRGLEWLRFGEGLTEKSVAMTSRKIFMYELGNDAEPVNRHAIFDFRKAPEVGEAIALVMVGVHQTLAKHFNNPGDDDPQMTPIVLDNMLKVAGMLQNHQVKKGGEIQVGQTLMQAIMRTYLERARPEVREELRSIINEKIFGDTGKENFEGKLMTLADRLQVLAKRSDQTIRQETVVEEAVEEFETGRFFDEITKQL